MAQKVPWLIVERPWSLLFVGVRQCAQWHAGSESAWPRSIDGCSGPGTETSIEWSGRIDHLFPEGLGGPRRRRRTLC